MLTALRRHPAVAIIAKALRDAPHAGIFVVGGSVRDALLKRPVKDLDVVVASVPLDQLEDMLKTVGYVDIVGKRFAVLKLTLPNMTVVDVALPRTDASFGTGRYKDVEVRADPNLPIEKDLERRDFTINAMAWNVKTQELVDPHDGRKDLRSRIIRAVGNPRERFQEDATRILRAVRLVVELGFAVEQNTAHAIKEKLPLLVDESITPPEVIAKELVRALVASPVQALDLFDHLGILRALIPELDAMRGCEQPPQYHAEGDVWTHTRIALAALESLRFKRKFKRAPTAQLVIVTLFHDIGKPPTQKTPERHGTDRIRFDRHAPVGAQLARNICKRLKLSSTGVVDCEQLVWLIEHHLDTLNLNSMRPSTLEKTYLIPHERGLLLQQLTWADASASLNPDEVRSGKKFHASRRFKQLQTLLREIERRGFKNRAPKALLSGDDVMNILKIASGPRIGEALEQLRNAQLSGTITTREQAMEFVTNLHAD